jgi:sporulation protein YlmC with PRC-barrel domain
MTRLKQSVRVLMPVLGLSVALTAFGADNMNRSAPAGTANPAATPPGARPAAPASQDRMGDIRASKLIGKNVRNGQGQGVGEIRDLVVDANNGQVQYAVLEFDPGWFKSEKLFAYPLGQFSVAEGDRLVLDVDKDRLKTAPGFAKDRWPNWNDVAYRGELDKYHGSRAVQSMANGRYVRASKLLDADVKSAEGKDVGDIEDVVVNMRTGKVHYVVLDFDAGWFKSDKLVALPMTAFKPTRDGDDLIVSIDKSRLESAPAFDRKQWPENDRGFNDRIDRYGMSSSTATGASATTRGERSAPVSNAERPADAGRPATTAPHGVKDPARPQ